MFFCHTIFYKNKRQDKAICKKDACLLRRDDYFCSSNYFHIWETKYEKWNGFDMAEMKNINLCLNSCSFRVLFLLSEPSGEACSTRYYFWTRGSKLSQTSFLPRGGKINYQHCLWYKADTEYRWQTPLADTWHLNESVV